MQNVRLEKSLSLKANIWPIRQEILHILNNRSFSTLYTKTYRLSLTGARLIQSTISLHV